MNESIMSKKDVLYIVTESLTEVVGDRMTGYDSPLNKIVDEVVGENSEKIKKIVSDSLENVLADDDFKSAVQSEFKHKVAKNLVGKLEGTVKKAVDAIRQDQTIRARMILAIENIIKK